MTEKKEGWFSEAAAKAIGSVFWVNEYGTDVEVTAVGGGDEYKWPDKVFVGYVVRFSRPGRRSSVDWSHF